MKIYFVFYECKMCSIYFHDILMFLIMIIIYKFLFLFSIDNDKDDNEFFLDKLIYKLIFGISIFDKIFIIF